jgi:hypothetical protein
MLHYRLFWGMLQAGLAVLREISDTVCGLKEEETADERRLDADERGFLN